MRLLPATGSLRPFLALLMAFCVMHGRGAHAQVTDTLAARAYTQSYGVEIVLTNSGFGLGGLLRQTAGMVTSFVIETHIVSGKDPREAAFFDIFGRRSIPEKANYFLMLPLRVGVERRLLRADIEENFRPFVRVTIGPTFGWTYPYYHDQNANQERDEGEPVFGTFEALPRGEPRLGVGALIAVGAYFGTGTVTRSLRIGYGLNYFFNPIQLLEPEVKDARAYFGTPTISFTFGRLW